MTKTDPRAAEWEDRQLATGHPVRGFPVNSPLAPGQPMLSPLSGSHVLSCGTAGPSGRRASILLLDAGHVRGLAALLLWNDP